MLELWIDMVNPDRVDPNAFHEGCVQRTLPCVGEWIIWASLICNALELSVSTLWNLMAAPGEEAYLY